jgi:tRNA pseudouridine38-40 synthase
MSRYFLEVCYKGTGYAGFQIQQNAVTIQSEVEQALGIFFRKPVMLTGSSRTDTGVHALQNFFHFDLEAEVDAGCVYNLNALLPEQIAVNSLIKVPDRAHCRFDAIARQYRYVVYRRKDPFLTDRAYYFPYVLDPGLMQEAAEMVRGYTDFSSFAKRNSQVKTFQCSLYESGWTGLDGRMEYTVRGNRFLRGMVKGLVGTMLQVGRKKIGLEEFRSIIESGDSSRVDFSIPGYGLWLEKVEYAEGYFAL